MSDVVVYELLNAARAAFRLAGPAAAVDLLSDRGMDDQAVAHHVGLIAATSGALTWRNLSDCFDWVIAYLKARHLAESNIYAAPFLKVLRSDPYGVLRGYYAL
jgi:hypothetical protein